jgi:hypothetical protein
MPTKGYRERDVLRHLAPGSLSRRERLSDSRMKLVIDLCAWCVLTALWALVAGYWLVVY